MDRVVLSRRGFLRLSAGGAALGGLAALGVDLRPAIVRAQALRLQNAKPYPSVCPYCAVGCDTVVWSANDQIVNVEGDLRSPINHGNLCPKGAAIYQLHVNPNRVTDVLYRAPGGDSWQKMDLDKALDMVADRVKKTRDATFVEKSDDGKTQMSSLEVFSLGGATIDNEWNHLQQKLLRGLGIVAIENQARI